MKSTSFRLSAVAAALLAAFALLGTASAIEVEGRPGRFEITSASINAQTGGCFAQYAEIVNGNIFVSGGSGVVHVQENKNVVTATCRFTDTSGIYEAGAEVGAGAEACSLTTEDGTLYTGGRVTVTSAGNNAPDGSDGGNSIIRCQFKL